MAFTTKKSLLARVGAGDEISWREFYDTYRPLIILCGKDCALTADENEELVQQVMCEFFQKDIIQRYNPDEVPADVVFKHDEKRGRFRHYFKAIVRNHARKIYHRRKGHCSLEEIPELAAENTENLWEDEWRKHVLVQAFAELRTQVHAETFAAFEMYAIQGRPAREVADFLNLSVNSVYVAKNRCTEALKTIVSNLEAKDL